MGLKQGEGPGSEGLKGAGWPRWMWQHREGNTDHEAQTEGWTGIETGAGEGGILRKEKETILAAVIGKHPHLSDLTYKIHFSLSHSLMQTLLSVRPAAGPVGAQVPSL